MTRFKGLLILTITALAFAQVSAAQMMGGGNTGGGMSGGGMTGGGMGSGGTRGGSYGSGMGMGMGSGMDGESHDGMLGGTRFLVAPGGTVIATTGASADQGGSAQGTELVAVATTGQRARTWKADGSIRSTLVSLRLGSGVEAWRLTLDGPAVALQAGTDRVLAVVAKSTTSQSNGSGSHMGSGQGTVTTVSRTLVAIDASGRLIWSVALD